MRATDASKSASKRGSLKRHQGEQRNGTDEVAGQKVAVGDPEDVSEEEVFKTDLYPRVLDESNAKGEGEDVERGDGRFVFDPRAAGNQVTTEGDEDRGEESSQQEAAGIQTDEDRGQGEPGKHRVGERIGDQREPSQHDVGAKKAVGKANEQTRQQRPAHEFILKWLRDPVHRLRPLKIFVEKARSIFSLVSVCAVGPKETNSPLRIRT